MELIRGAAKVKKSLIVNTSWLFGDKVIRLVLGLIVSILMARSFGPVNLGKWNYAESFFGMFMIFTTLGFDSIIVRDLVKEKHLEHQLLGTSIILKLIGTMTSILLSFLFINFVRPDDEIVKLINLILSTAALLQIFDVIDYWFRSEMYSKYTVIAKNIGFIISSGIKITMLLLKVSMIYIAICSYVEFLVGSILLIYFYYKQKHSLTNWSFDLKIAKRIMNHSWPIILSSSAVLIQARIDQVIIGEMLGDAAVGQYSVALRLIEVLGFVPVVISTAFAPLVTKAKLKGEREYNNTLCTVYRLMFIVFLFTSIPIFFYSHEIVTVLYGQAFSQAGGLLSLFAIRLFFTNFGVAKSLFISNESLFKYTLFTSIIGAGTNILFNFWLIPILNVEGSLVATIMSFTISIFLIDIFFDRINRNLKLMLYSIITFWKFKLNELKVG